MTFPLKTIKVGLQMPTSYIIDTCQLFNAVSKSATT